MLFSSVLLSVASPGPPWLLMLFGLVCYSILGLLVELVFGLVHFRLKIQTLFMVDCQALISSICRRLSQYAVREWVVFSLMFSLVLCIFWYSTLLH